MNIQLKAQDAAAVRPLAGKVSLVTGSTSGIGLGIARALAEAGLRRGAERLRQRRRDRQDAGPDRRRFRRQGQLFRRRHVEGREAIAEMIATTHRQSRPARRAGQQCRHPACRAARAVSGREMGRDPRDQPVVGVPHHAAGAAGDAPEQVRAASSTSPPRMGWSPRPSRRPMSRPSTASSA